MTVAHSKKDGWKAITNSGNGPDPPLACGPGILPGQLIKKLNIVTPCVDRTVFEGMTYGVGPAGYDIRLGADTYVYRDCMTLAVSFEHFTMPLDILGVVHDKSTWARLGIFVQNTVIEPGWTGYLTIEITKHKIGLKPQVEHLIKSGTPIAQVIFHKLVEPTELPYAGKYNNQPNMPVSAILEK